MEAVEEFRKEEAYEARFNGVLHLFMFQILLTFLKCPLFRIDVCGEAKGVAGGSFAYIA